MFDSIDAIQEALRGKDYIPSTNIATVVYLAERMHKPILVEGPAGVGKTDLAKMTAEALGRPLIRLQCYEGLDECKALYEWEYAKQILYTQILKEKISEVLGEATTLTEAVRLIEEEQDDVFFSENFLLPRPLLQAIQSDEPSVLLIDEVDKSDPEFEAFLLELLSDWQVSVPELGTITAKHLPLVFLTSNNEREMTNALKRRCLHLYIDFPDAARETEIVRLKVPGVADQLAEAVVQFVQSVRELDLKKQPSISETLDWARALVILNADQLEKEVVENTLNLLLKYEGDINKVRPNIPNLLTPADQGAMN